MGVYVIYSIDCGYETEILCVTESRFGWTEEDYIDWYCKETHRDKPNPNGNGPFLYAKEFTLGKAA
jgi:hypothetical protein